MKAFLHLTAGDGLLGSLRQTALTGEMLPWREALAMGPVHASDEAAFWQQRAAYLQGQFPEAKQSYETNVHAIWRQLKAMAPLDELVLWVGAEYFCQINLMFLLSHLPPSLRAAPVSLVCRDQHPSRGRLHCLGDLKPEALERLFPERIRLQPEDFHLAAQAWQAYASPSLEAHNLWMDLPASERLPFLPATAEAHLRLFPSIQTGLNALEILALELLAEQPALTHRAWVGKLLQADLTYGMGDGFYFNLLERLQPLYAPLETEGEWLQISSEGRELLDGELNLGMELHGEAPLWLGGLASQQACWHPTTGRLSAPG